jgi:hypothetical protein
VNLSRNARLALVFAALTVLCGGAVCFAAVRIAPVLLGLDCEPSQTPSVSPVYTDTVAVSRRFPRLGPIEQAHWQSRQARPRTCPDIGPMDYITEGLVTLEPQTAAGYRRDHSWTPATPEIPAALAASVPAGARWTHSQDFDAAMGTGTFYADAGSATLYFVHHTS